MKKSNYSKSFCRFRIIFLLILLVAFISGFENRLNAQPEVSGPTLVCTSAQYTINCGCTPTWRCSSNLTLTSGQGTTTATFSANGNGIGWVKATWCDIYSDDQNIWIGPPIIDYVVDEGKYPEQHLYDIAFYPAYYDISDPEYSLEVDYPGEVWSCSMGWAQVYLPGDPSQYGFILTSTNACGNDYLQFYFNEVWY